MKRFILCAGFGYEFKGEPFGVFSETRLRQIVDSNSRGEETTILSFDVGAGTLKTTNITWKTGTQLLSSKTEKLFQPVTRKSYDKSGFKDNQPNVMSIRDIYRSIVNVGKSDPASLIEVSIFSHAYYDGPILVNSNDDRRILIPGRPVGGPNSYIALPEAARNPNDKDGRASKDFVPPNMSNDDAASFRAAFTAKGYVWIWGCNFPRDLNRILSLVEKNPRYSPTIGDDRVLEFYPLKADEISSFLAFDIFKLDAETLRKTRRCSVPFGAIKDAVRQGMEASYVYHLATQMKVRAIGALYGTYADFFGGSPRLMAISSRTLRHVQFYKRHFDIKTDSEGRNYGVFEPDPIADS